MQATDILILSNGPGEVTTWVRPVVKALRDQLGDDRTHVRISLVLSPCPNATGKEVAIAQRYPEIDRIQSAEHFFPFLLWGKTAANWDWRKRGVVLFLGGDQLYPVLIAKRLGYSTVIYGEWDTRWHRWVDRFGVRHPRLIDQAPPRYAAKFTVVGDLMAEASSTSPSPPTSLTPPAPSPLLGLLPGSKPAKLAQGVPLMMAIAELVQVTHPHTRFVIPVAPTLDVETLARFGDPSQNAIARYFGNPSATLQHDEVGPYLKTGQGVRIDLYTDFPAHDLLRQCDLCLTTVGANTAELGAMAVPMIVLLPTQQLDAMRAWDGLPGLLANLPGVGSGMAKLINRWFLRQERLLAWPNIWAGTRIVPELIGDLEPGAIATQITDWLDHPEPLEAMRQNLRQVRGEAGAARKLVNLVVEALQSTTV